MLYVNTDTNHVWVILKTPDTKHHPLIGARTKCTKQTKSSCVNRDRLSHPSTCVTALCTKAASGFRITLLYGPECCTSSKNNQSVQVGRKRARLKTKGEEKSLHLAVLISQSKEAVTYGQWERRATWVQSLCAAPLSVPQVKF